MTIVAIGRVRARRLPCVLTRMMRVAISTGLFLAGVSCGDDGTGGTGPDLGLPLVGNFAGVVDAGETVTASVIAGRSTSTMVSVCGPTGVNFDLSVAGQTASSPANCETVTFSALAGHLYAVSITAVAGGGPYSGCYSISLAPCTARTPHAFGGDTTAPAGYYANAEGKTGATLLAALHTIIDGHRSFDYTTARDSLYAVVDDPDDDDIIVDLYVGRAATINSRSSAAAANINAEHTWPRSRGADIEYPAGTDLHMLMSADEDANGQRLNYPFGIITGSVLWESPVVSGTPERSRRGYNAAGQIVFEPRASRRGDIARALLYFYVRYRNDAPDAPAFALGNFNIEESALILWSQQDPVDAFERARHARVYRVQLNRNPFIDHPEYVTAVGDFPNTLAP
jgi:endonuclease I